MNTDNIQPARTPNKTILLARGRLANAKKWFAHRGWDVLPKGRRGRRILEWGACQAWLASPANPERSLRRWLRRWAPWLKDSELAELIERIRDSDNKSWTPDQCAMVLQISLTHRTELKLWFLGCEDDPNYERRAEIEREKNAAKQRKHRAKHSTGAPRGRPRRPAEEKKAKKTAKRRSDGIVPRDQWLAANSKSRTEPWKALDISKSTYYRLGLQDDAVRQVWLENAYPYISKNRSGYGFNAHDLSHEKSKPIGCAERPKRDGAEQILIVDMPDDGGGVAWARRLNTNEVRHVPS